MAVTGGSPALREALLSEIGRIISSEVLRGSESLCQLLGYLASHSVGERSSSVKEYQIATEVFGRTADFDPRIDSTVRVQTSRLRAKLAEYYAGPGAQDPLIVDIPRGAYSVVVRPRPVREESPPHIEVHTAEVAPVVRPDRYRIAAWLLSIVCCGLIVSLYVARSRPVAIAEVRPEIPAALKAFWHVFMGAPERTWVVFSNAEFVGRPETGLRYLDPAKDKDKSDAIFDHYTGIGEVMAIHELDQLFTKFQHGVVVKRALSVRRPKTWRYGICRPCRSFNFAGPTRVLAKRTWKFLMCIPCRASSKATSLRRGFPSKKTMPSSACCRARRGSTR